MDGDRQAWLADKARNRFLEKLRRGEPALTLGVRGWRSPEIARIAKAAGNDAIWVDLEHSTMPVDLAAQICAAAADIGLTPFVRVPEREFGIIGRLLDGGAQGIIVPRIESARQAADIGAACRFPPRGQRSAIATLAWLDYERLDAATLNATLNGTVVYKPLIETWAGIEAVDAIAALDCVDIVGIGTNDLTAELGVPGDFRHPRVRDAHERALQACQRHGKLLAIGGIGDAAYVAELIRLGAAPFLFTGIDSDLCLAAAQQRVQQARDLLGK